ncbi:XF1762 family protein [Streptomyces sp. HPF1205]|uniref:XF1762 family protein n=1 Tax=Streptomyces sp. HPF1205 TaxID=2873262 RepID=UPI001CEDB816|nr:XF1762 family protein [Streptomyces sp. HPF1205]
MTGGLHLVPVRFRQAVAFVAEHHRHHGPPRGLIFSVGVVDDEEALRGVLVAGRPVARHYDNGRTLEVTRVATDGVFNGNSMLYGAARRASLALGYTRLITYTQQGETGASLRAAGWALVAERRPRPGWNTPSRPRQPTGTENITRYMWEAA